MVEGCELFPEAFTMTASEPGPQRKQVDPGGLNLLGEVDAERGTHRVGSESDSKQPSPHSNQSGSWGLEVLQNVGELNSFCDSQGQTEVVTKSGQDWTTFEALPTLSFLDAITLKL